MPWTALLVVYLFWGATYVAIRIGVETVPPLLLASTRYLLAGAVLYAFVARPSKRSEAATRTGTKAAWLAAGIVGILTLAIGNGGLTYAEQTVPSGLAALLVATVPLWMIGADRLINGHSIGRVQVVAMLIGLIGVAILAGVGGPGGGALAGKILLLAASASWAIGSVISGRLSLPADPLRSAAMQMLSGGAALMVVAGLSGELSNLDVHAVSGRSLLALLFLVGPGSLLALTAYVVALRTLPTSTVATYAYVNPVVAVALGALLLGETFTRATAIGATVVVAAVAVSLRRPVRRPAKRS